MLRCAALGPSMEAGRRGGLWPCPGVHPAARAEPSFSLFPSCHQLLVTHGDVPAPSLSPDKRCQHGVGSSPSVPGRGQRWGWMEERAINKRKYSKAAPGQSCEGHRSVCLQIAAPLPMAFHKMSL